MTDAYVNYHGGVSRDSMSTLAQTLADLSGQGYSRLHLLMATGGGDVESGFYAHSFIRALPAKIITYNLGSVASIGTVIFLAGEERYAVPQSSFMFHGAAMTVAAGGLDQRRLTELLASVTELNNRMGGVIADRTQYETDDIREFWLQERVVGAEQAQAHGIIHGIRSPSIPEGAPVFSIRS